MAAISGKNGTVYWGGSAEAEVTNIQINEQANVEKFNSNTAGGAKKAIAGATEWGGTFEMKDKPTFNAGASATLYISDWQNSHTGTVVIGQISKTIDVLNGGVVTFTVTFEGNGALTKSTGSAP